MLINWTALRFYLVMLTVLFSSVTYAQTIVTDRPDQTEASSTVPKQSFQIESGLIAQFSGSGNSRARSFTAPTTLFRYGVIKCLELRLVSELALQHTGEGRGSVRTFGINDLQVGLKVQLFRKDDNATEVALMSHLVVPSGSSGQSNGLFGTVNKLCISHGLSDRIGLGYNVGYNYLGGRYGDLTYSLSVAFGITDKLGIFLEPYGSWNDFDTVTTNFDGGFTYLIKDNLQYDFSIGVGLDNRMNFISTGISWNIATKSKPVSE